MAVEALPADELDSGIARQAELVEVVVELIVEGPDAQREHRAAVLINQAPRTLMFRNLGNARTGGVAGIHEQIADFRAQVVKALVEFCLHAAADGGGGVVALSHDLGSGTGKRHVGDQVVERIVISRNAETGRLARPVNADLAAGHCLGFEVGVGFGERVADAEAAVKLVECGSAEGTISRAAKPPVAPSVGETGAGTEETSVLRALPGETAARPAVQVQRPPLAIHL